MSSLIPSMSILGGWSTSVMDESAGGDGGGVCSMRESSLCDRFLRLLGCASADSESDLSGDNAAEAEGDVRDAPLEAAAAAAAAARAACVMGT